MKFKPILHKFGSWPYQKTIVELKVYRPTEYAGASELLPSFGALPSHIFHNYSVESVSGGYHLKVRSSNPVKIRRVTSELMEEMAKNTTRINSRWINHNIFKEHYEPALNGDKTQIHEDILDIVEKGTSKTGAQIKKYIDEELDHNAIFFQLALDDLLHSGEVVRDPENNNAYLLNDSDMAEAD